MKNAKKLIKDVDKLKMKWDEYSSFNIKGISNLSVADLDLISMYAQAYVNSNGQNFEGFIQPFGPVKEVLDAYDVKVQSFGIW